MKLKLNISNYFVLYFFLLMGLFHYKIKGYPYWEYVGFLKSQSFGFIPSRFFLSLLLFSINLALLSTLRKTKMSFIVLSIFFALITIPSLIAFTTGSNYPGNLLIYHQSFFFVLFGFSRINVNFAKVPTINKSQSLYLLLLTATIGIIPYIVVYGPYINLKNLLLMDVYETRFKMRPLSNPYFGYSYSVFTKIVIPLIIVFGLELKKKVWVFVGALYLILFYLFGAHKSVYVGLFVVFIFYKFSYAKSIHFILKYSCVLIVLFAVLAYFGWDYPWILSFRRVHFSSALLDICYLDFFKNNYLYWSESIFKGLIEYPYDVQATHLIGDLYFKRPDMSANNGFISDGYMNFGSTGVFINIIIVSVYFSILNSLHIPSKYFGLYLVTMFSFLSSPVSTVFLTHGGLALLLASIFLLNQRPTAQVTR